MNLSVLILELLPPHLYPNPSQCVSLLFSWNNVTSFIVNIFIFLCILHSYQSVWHWVGTQTFVKLMMMIILH
jgi:hypothetical protein